MKFDADLAAMALLAARVPRGEDPCSGVIEYVNQYAEEHFGLLRGGRVGDFFERICGDANGSADWSKRICRDGQAVIEGTLAQRLVHVHTRLIRSAEGDDSADVVQAGIIDITESYWLNHALYGASEALKRAASAADEDTGEHVERLNHYSEALAKLLGMGSEFVDDISRYAQLHDIGKIKVARIVKLPRHLTDDEFEEMKRHTIYGARMLEGLVGLEMAHDIALEHHERWDGSGYPHGKKGDEIAIAARIVAIADVFDALVSERPYKRAFTYREAFDIIATGDGRVRPDHFDPQIHEQFMANFDVFVRIHQSLSDPDLMLARDEQRRTGHPRKLQ